MERLQGTDHRAGCATGSLQAWTPGQQAKKGRRQQGTCMAAHAWVVWWEQGFWQLGAGDEGEGGQCKRVFGHHSVHGA